MKWARVFLAVQLAATCALAADPTERRFTAELSADNETRTVDSAGKGAATAVIDLPTLTLKWHVTYSGLTSEVTSVRLHGPAQVGANGVPFLDLAPKGAKSPLDGSAELTEGQIQYMLARWSYIEISTKKFPKGEIRGQMIVVPPPKE
jgi:hypothetical protein